MKSTCAQLTRLVLTLIGALAMVWLGVSMAYDGQTVTARIFGWVILGCMLIGLAGSARTRKSKTNAPREVGE